jgi:cytosine deaminase
MITGDAARLMRATGYGVREGAQADLVLLDTTQASSAIAELAQPLWGMKSGRMTFTRDRPVLHRPRVPA